jgi:7-keto-8-aminopelargonate synthetase-like enzyme
VGRQRGKFSPECGSQFSQHTPSAGHRSKKIPVDSENRIALQLMPTREMTSRRRRQAADLAIPLQQIHRTEVLMRGRRLSYFAGCDYYRLSSHPLIVAAVHRGLDEFGLNVAASRKTTGNHTLYGELESALARFFRFPSATLTSNGYVANLCLAQALCGTATHALVDERAHSSLQDALQLLGCPVSIFRHRDPRDAERLARRVRPEARIVLMTDGLFSHSGEVAPLDRYCAQLPESALVVVDDAHGAGVLGAHGRGTLEHLRVKSDRVIQTITLSKAFGSYGGAILGPAWLRACITEHSRYFIGNTPLPLPLAKAALTALQLVRKDPALRQRLATNTARVKAALRSGGLAVNASPGPIVPIHPRSADGAQQLSRALLKAGIHPPLIQYSATEDAYFRFVISSEHKAKQLDALIETLLTHRIPVVVPPHGS